MHIGILGSGLMGGKLGTILAKAGHDVVFSYARSRRKLTRLAREAGSRAAAGTPREAAEEADVLLLAVHWSRVNDVLKQAGPLSGKMLITCSNTGKPRTDNSPGTRRSSLARSSRLRARSARSQQPLSP